jgi:hypothetical protein
MYLNDVPNGLREQLVFLERPSSRPEKLPMGRQVLALTKEFSIDPDETVSTCASLADMQDVYDLFSNGGTVSLRFAVIPQEKS